MYEYPFFANCTYLARYKMHQSLQKCKHEDTHINICEKYPFFWQLNFLQIQSQIFLAIMRAHTLQKVTFFLQLVFPLSSISCISCHQMHYSVSKKSRDISLAFPLSYYLIYPSHLASLYLLSYTNQISLETPLMEDK